ncbi:MAG TPA: RidA family protein [Moorella mulderi]|nr:RidA family protein [Moorella mulderi]
MKEIISTPEAPQAIGPYSQGVRSGEFLFISGQLPLDPAPGEIVPGDVTLQAEQALKNLEAILKAAGSGMDKVVKTTIFLKNIQDFKAVNEVYSRFFKHDPPARSAFAVAELPRGALIEIEAIALVK